jgi:hypothetical protein
MSAADEWERARAEWHGRGKGARMEAAGAALARENAELRERLAEATAAHRAAIDDGMAKLATARRDALLEAATLLGGGDPGLVPRRIVTDKLRALAGDAP